MIRNQRTCKEWTAELVEHARLASPGHGAARDRQPGDDLRMHLAVCESCRERWERERLLTSHLAAIRNRTAAFRSHESRGEELMRAFVHRHKVRVIRSWGLALGAAAAVILAVLLGQMAGHAQHKKPIQGLRQAGISDSGDVMSLDASALSSDDFMAVPYTPPLAQGEMVRVVHADLDPDALANMGVQVDPAYSSGRVPADVVIGEDGFPRAVRITENNNSF